MTNAYDRQLRKKAQEIAKKEGFAGILKEGVFSMMTGPMFETPTEVRALQTFGVDAVGMSTVPEVYLFTQKIKTI